MSATQFFGAMIAACVAGMHINRLYHRWTEPAWRKASRLYADQLNEYEDKVAGLTARNNVHAQELRHEREQFRILGIELKKMRTTCSDLRNELGIAKYERDGYLERLLLSPEQRHPFIVEMNRKRDQQTYGKIVKKPTDVPPKV
jgi:hypothetical protein